MRVARGQASQSRVTFLSDAQPFSSGQLPSVKQGFQSLLVRPRKSSTMHTGDRAISLAYTDLAASSEVLIGCTCCRDNLP